ncbi:hypothetical protein V6N13_009671 [Hibiscus sabdariffa]|uniref:Uncharacterized protein n=2 Tax=Hibiscus sabdariffa TaxID=183260 RepID=A0ABR2NNT9_9ROSI
MLSLQGIVRYCNILLGSSVSRGNAQRPRFEFGLDFDPSGGVEAKAAHPNGSSMANKGNVCMEQSREEV